jgi:transposase
MANLMKAVPNPESKPAALPTDPEVVAVARRRQFSRGDKRRILAAADRCSKPGEIGALLRREGIYSSQLATWRKQRAAAGVSGLDVRKRGVKADPAIAEGHRTAKLTREIDRLRRQLTQAQMIIEVQKKVSALLALQTADDSDGES